MKALRITALIVSFVLLVSLASCSDGAYRADRSCEEIASTLGATLPVELVPFSSDHLSNVFSNVPLPVDWAHLYESDSVGVTEIGVFRGNDEAHAKELLAVASDRLAERLETERAFLASYAPEELIKLEQAEVRRYGVYVILCVCSPSQKEAFFSEAESFLQQSF